MRIPAITTTAAAIDPGMSHGGRDRPGGTGGGTDPPAGWSGTIAPHAGSSIDPPNPSPVDDILCPFLHRLGAGPSVR